MTYDEMKKKIQDYAFRGVNVNFDETGFLVEITGQVDDLSKIENELVENDLYADLYDYDLGDDLGLLQYDLIRL